MLLDGLVLSAVPLQKGIIDKYVGKVAWEPFAAPSVLLALSRTRRDVVACSGSATCHGFESLPLPPLPNGYHLGPSSGTIIISVSGLLSVYTLLT